MAIKTSCRRNLLSFVFIVKKVKKRIGLKKEGVSKALSFRIAPKSPKGDLLIIRYLQNPL